MSRGNQDKTLADSGKNALTMERLVLDELPSHQQRHLEARLGSDRLAESRRTLVEDNARFLELHPAERVTSQIERRLERAQEELHAAKTRRPTIRRLAWSAPALAVAAVMLAIWIGTGDSPRNSGTLGNLEESILIKGLDPDMRIYLRNSGTPVPIEQSEPLRDGDTVHAGSEIQLGYIASGRQFGVIVSIDGAGSVTLHAPDDPGQTARLQDNGEVLLQHSFRLDDAPLFERFFFVTASTPIAPDEVIRSARELAHDPHAAVEQPLALPEDWEQISFTLRKESP